MKIYCLRSLNILVTIFFYSRIFCVDKEYWCNIYANKIKYMYNKRLCEFNYNLFNNILSCNSFLYKCKLRPNSKYDFCDSDLEDIKHLLFECNNVKCMWECLSSVLKYSIQWKHIVLGFYLETNTKVSFYNTIMSYSAYKIYKSKMRCRIQNNIQECSKLKQFIKNS